MADGSARSEPAPSEGQIADAVGRLALQMVELEGVTAEGLVELRARILDLERRCHELEGRLNETVEQPGLAEGAYAARAAKKRARRSKNRSGGDKTR